MTKGDYTPTAEEVRKAHVTSWFVPEPERAVDEFDRWLASVRADAWDEGARHVMDAYSIPGEPSDGNPYRSKKQ